MLRCCSIRSCHCNLMYSVTQARLSCRARMQGRGRLPRAGGSHVILDWSIRTRCIKLGADGGDTVICTQIQSLCCFVDCVSVAGAVFLYVRLTVLACLMLRCRRSSVSQWWSYYSNYTNAPRYSIANEVAMILTCVKLHPHTPPFADAGFSPKIH